MKLEFKRIINQERQTELEKLGSRVKGSSIGAKTNSVYENVRICRFKPEVKQGSSCHLKLASIYLTS